MAAVALSSLPGCYSISTANANNLAVISRITSIEKCSNACTAELAGYDAFSLETNGDCICATADDLLTPQWKPATTCIPCNGVFCGTELQRSVVVYLNRLSSGSGSTIADSTTSQDPFPVSKATSISSVKVTDEVSTQPRSSVFTTQTSTEVPSPSFTDEISVSRTLTSISTESPPPPSRTSAFDTQQSTAPDSLTDTPSTVPPSTDVPDVPSTTTKRKTTSKADDGSFTFGNVNPPIPSNAPPPPKIGNKPGPPPTARLPPPGSSDGPGGVKQGAARILAINAVIVLALTGLAIAA